MKDLDFTNCKILIVGDLILDQYITGQVNRISPEAPVPVVKVKSMSYTLGGAGNTLNNIVNLKAKVRFISLTGDDNNSSILEKILNDIEVDYHLLKKQSTTCTKIRVVGSNQQIARIDIENIEELSNTDEDSASLYIKKYIDETDLVIISDYGKGFCSYNLCQNTIQLSQNKNIPVIIDPKGDNWSKYTNATMITPNINELAIISGKETIKNENNEIEKYGREVLEQYNISSLIVTRSEKGISIITANSVDHLYAEARDVYDVSGAGDTVVATLAVSVAKGMPLQDCVKLANIAAGIVISKKGTTPIELHELKSSFYSDTAKKIISPVDLIEKIKTIRETNQTIVFTNGCFDILHR